MRYVHERISNGVLDDFVYRPSSLIDVFKPPLPSRLCDASSTSQAMPSISLSHPDRRTRAFGISVGSPSASSYSKVKAPRLRLLASPCAAASASARLA